MNWLNCFSCKEKAQDDVKTLDYNRTGLTEVPPEVFNFERTLETLYLDGNKVSRRLYSIRILTSFVIHHSTIYYKTMPHLF